MMVYVCTMPGSLFNYLILSIYKSTQKKEYIFFTFDARLYYMAGTNVIA